MLSKRNLGKSKRIAPVNLWNTLLPAEKAKVHEVLVQIAEEVIAPQHCEISPKQVTEEIVIQDTTVH